MAKDLNKICQSGWAVKAECNAAAIVLFVETNSRRQELFFVVLFALSASVFHQSICYRLIYEKAF